MGRVGREGREARDVGGLGVPPARGYPRASWRGRLPVKAVAKEALPQAQTPTDWL